jgi:hypothetical protein
MRWQSTAMQLLAGGRIPHACYSGCGSETYSLLVTQAMEWQPRLTLVCGAILGNVGGYA